MADVGKIHGILLDGENSGVALNTFLADVLSMATDLLLYNAQSKVVGTSYYMQALDHLASYGGAAAGKLCGLFSRLTSARNRYLTVEQVVMEVLAAFHAVDETTKVVYVQASDKKAPVLEEVPVKPELEESKQEETKTGEASVEVEDADRKEEPSKPEESVPEKAEEPPIDNKGFKNVEPGSVPFDMDQEEDACSFDARSLLSGAGAFGFGVIATAGGKRKRRAKENQELTWTLI